MRVGFVDFRNCEIGSPEFRMWSQDLRWMVLSTAEIFVLDKAFGRLWLSGELNEYKSVAAQILSITY
jgi:hypothetical protein